MHQNQIRERMHLSIYKVSKMDCPSEENLIRNTVTHMSESVAFSFDLQKRIVRIYHSDSPDKINSRMTSLGLGAKCLSHELVDGDEVQQVIEDASARDVREMKVLKWLLAINAIMFITELGVGLAAESAGLIADSLDMLADAAVYGISLYAVGKAARYKSRAAHVSGYMQLALALGVLLEVTRRFVYGSEPISLLIIGAGLAALIANVICLLLIFKSRNDGSHMKASWIFSTNDVLANVGVMTAGVLVYFTNSQIPDLIIGVVIAGLVSWGAVRILRLK